MTLAISIVTPTLNAERYLPECLGSLDAQGHPGLEHLVVDGGSTDSTCDIVRARPSSTWVAAPGLKQSQAINLGLHRAVGEVVAWLNADDTYPPGSLARVEEVFSTRPEVEVVFGDCAVRGAHGQPLWHEQPGPYDFDRLLRRGNYLAQPAVFLRRSLLDRVGVLDESLEFAMDYDLWLRLRHARSVYLPCVLATFRWHPDSKTARNTLGNWRENMRIVRRYRGGWTPWLAWAYARAVTSVAKARLLGSHQFAAGRARGLSR